MLSIVLALALFAPSQASAQALDTDRDGLPDAHEIHKYGTDPYKRDSDGDGTEDGDWRERREYAYTVRSVVQVMRPVTVEFLDDGYQDVRVLDETDSYVELEVIHYPLSTIAASAGIRDKPKDLARWLEPGPSSNASPELGRAIREAMEASGARVDDFTTAEGVVAAARWLLERAEVDDGFSSFITAFDGDGKPFVPEAFRPSVERGTSEKGLTLEEQWEREVLAAGMFHTKRRGSCTSSAIYLSGCLRALGVPTRTVLCIPIIDASDENEWRMVDIGIHHHAVRATIHAALDGGRGAWTSHTFNEVYVDGRWRRLNYATLDQGILDGRFLGLMTHVGTFHDWADARMWETVGRRQMSDAGADVFGHRNPYSTISLRDEFGAHCDVENPELPTPEVDVVALHWTDSSDLPVDIRRGNAERGRFGLIAEAPASSTDALRRFLDLVDRRIWLEGEGVPKIETTFDPGCWWFKQDRAFIYVPLSRSGRGALVNGVTYRAVARNGSERATWGLDLDVRRD